MASGNRVEELESRVKELEATVDGLTDELVECKVRIRELENAVESEDPLTAADNRNAEQSAAETVEPEPEPEPEPAAEPEPADTSKSEGAEADENESDEAESESDIIIA